jgi:HD-GYP domain-containing protein (c-di-GMP phosphodiesterase class II)
VDRARLFSLTRLVEMKDACTAAHTWRVALYTQALAESMDVDTPTVRRLMRAAALHDVGKIDVPKEILTKPGRLTDAEFEVVKLHPTTGYRRLIQWGETDQLVLQLVRWHHERIDGTGYPDALEGEEIPVAARLFAVIDTFDAMTSVRPYRRATGHGAAVRALEELQHKAERWYCIDAVKQLQMLHERGRLEWIQRHFNDEATVAEWRRPRDVSEISDTVERLGHS